MRGSTKIDKNGVEIVKCFKLARFPIFKFIQEKCVNCDIFGKEIKNGGCFTSTSGDSLIEAP